MEGPAGPCRHWAVDSALHRLHLFGLILGIGAWFDRFLAGGGPLVGGISVLSAQAPRRCPGRGDGAEGSRVLRGSTGAIKEAGDEVAPVDAGEVPTTGTPAH